MTASNSAATAASQNPASNNPAQAIQIEYVAALKAIDTELLNASSLIHLHKIWIKKCYGSEQEWTDRSIQNAICVLSRRSKQHLQKAKAIAERIGQQDSLFYESIEFAEANIKILSEPYLAISLHEVMALLLVTDDFIVSVKNARNFLNSKIEKHQISVVLKDHDSDCDQADCSDVDKLTSYDHGIATRLDVVYSMLDALCDNITQTSENGKSYLDDPVEFIVEVRSIATELRAILSECADEYQSKEIEYALNHFYFLDKAFNAGVSIRASDRWSVFSILADARTAVYDAACGAGREQAEKILQPGGDLADDTVH